MVGEKPVYRFHTQSKRSYESNSAEIFTVVVYYYYPIATISYDSCAIGRRGKVFIGLPSYIKLMNIHNLGSIISEI